MRPGGYAIDIRGAALDVIDRMGLREVLRPLETDTLHTYVVDPRGRRFGHMARGFGVIDPQDFEVLRGDLARVLFESTRRNVHYRFGDGIASIDDRGDAVDVRFARGETGRYDVVIGADGVHSTTRALAFGPEASFVREMGSVMAIFTAPNHLGLDREQLLFNGVGRIASVKSDDHNRSLKVVVFFTAPPGALDPRSIDAQRALVAKAFANVGWEFPALMDAMMLADDFYCDITCQVHLERLHTGRVALVGDAAYCPSPMSGQGTSLALVGAYVLAAALAEHRANVPEALAVYDARMRPFASRNQREAMKVAAGFAPTTPFQLWSRNFAMRTLPYMPWKNWVMKKVMGGIADAARDISLPVCPPAANHEARATTETSPSSGGMPGPKRFAP